MTADEIRKKYIEFFVKKGHKEIPSASLVPPDDPTTLFTNSGMQQLVPYLKGQPHPMGTRIVNSQPCFRAEDIEEVGDDRHTTLFEMLGNWSLGDYFKKEQLAWFFEFLTKEININPTNLYVSVFHGDNIAKRDVTSIKIWQDLFQTKKSPQKGEKGFNPKIKIYTYDSTKNWWSRAGIPENMPQGEIGGTTSEVFFDFGEKHKLHENSKYKNKQCHLNCDCGRFFEIGNSVFMEYEKQKDGSFKPLPAKNVDFGGGLERTAAASQNQPDMFQIDMIKTIIREIEVVTEKKYEKQNKAPMQVIADHLRGATFMIAQGVEPSNKTQGYVLRRLLRRAAVKSHLLKGGLTPIPGFQSVCKQVIRSYGGMYFDETKARKKVDEVIDQEMGKFAKSLDRGLKQVGKVTKEKIDAKLAFDLFQTYGFPFEITQELLAKKGKEIDKEKFDKEVKKHQELSRTAAAGMFKGGLADKSEATIKLHTATHLLHKALRNVIGDHVRQEGSHITAERLRFDFSHPKALTEEEIKKIESLINKKIKEDLPVKRTIEDKDKALKSGALAFFKETYPEKVSVYTIGKDFKKDWFSKELCGGPHVKSTGEIGGIKIFKEKSIGSGIHRIYAKLA